MIKKFNNRFEKINTLNSKLKTNHGTILSTKTKNEEQKNLT